MTLSPREVVEAPAREWQRYPEYKDSGFGWLGEVPEHWDLKPLRYIFTVVGGSTPSSGVPEYWDGDIPWVTPEDLGQLPSDYVTTTRRQITQAGYGSCGTTMVPIGSLIMSTRAPVGHLAIAGNRLCTNQGCKALVLQKSETVRYYYYQLLTGRAEVRSWAQGSTFQELGRNKLGSIELVQPPLAEQQAIVAFLDRETQKIDELIAKRERLIELLKEKRTALISRAVTKGLDPDVPMKDSGVEWLGKIPEHWTLIALRRLLANIEQGWSPNAEDRVASLDEWSVIKISAIDKGFFRSEEAKALPQDVVPDLRYEIQAGDILLTRGNTPSLVGDVCVVGNTRPRLMLSDLVYRLCIEHQKVNRVYLAYWLLSRAGRYQITRDARGSSQSMVKVSQEHIRSWSVALPPLVEQQAIVTFVERETTKIDALVGKVREHIDRLREYRTALISAAVTGKIDVREETA